MQFHQTRLPNGLQIVAELNPRAYSVALGFMVNAGSRDETSEVSGVSHFLEHMAFKGDARHTADDVNRIFDELGAKYNAYTSEEVTFYHAAVLPEYLPQTFELLSILPFPSLRQEDFDVEKKVILEEIGMYQDQPNWVAFEAVMQQFFAKHPLGNSILGSPESITALTSEQMRDYHAQRYRAGNIVLAVTGNTTWEEVLRLAEKYCGAWPVGEPGRQTPANHPQPAERIITKADSVQQQVAQMSPAPSAVDPHRFAAELLTVIVGDHGSSRLYWDLVDTGDAEGADLGYHEYHGSGAWMTYLTCAPEDVEKNLARIQEIYDEVNRDGVTETEVMQAKSKVASRVVLRGERPKGRLGSLAGNWVYRQEYRSIEDDLADLRSVTVESIRKLLDEFPLGQMSTATVGPLESLTAS
jgi:predicted Zn-dependent peptidase